MPASNITFWREKFEANRKRDRRVNRQLRSLGWSVLVIWECQTDRPDWLLGKLRQFIDGRVP